MSQRIWLVALAALAILAAGLRLWGSVSAPIMPHPDEFVFPVVRPLKLLSGDLNPPQFYLPDVSSLPAGVGLRPFLCGAKALGGWLVSGRIRRVLHFLGLGCLGVLGAGNECGLCGGDRSLGWGTGTERLTLARIPPKPYPNWPTPIFLSATNPQASRWQTQVLERYPDSPEAQEIREMLPPSRP